MFFAWDITIPANTPKTTPVRQLLPIDFGLITRIDIVFPAGCGGLVRIRLLRYESQLVPLNPASWLRGDDETVPCEVYQEIYEAPAELKFEGGNEDDTYEHTIGVRINVIPKKKAPSITQILEALKEKFVGT